MVQVGELDVRRDLRRVSHALGLVFSTSLGISGPASNPPFLSVYETSVFFFEGLIDDVWILLRFHYMHDYKNYKGGCKSCAKMYYNDCYFEIYYHGMDKHLSADDEVSCEEKPDNKNNDC